MASEMFYDVRCDVCSGTTKSTDSNINGWGYLRVNKEKKSTLYDVCPRCLERLNIK